MLYFSMINHLLCKWSIFYELWTSDDSCLACLAFACTVSFFPHRRALCCIHFIIINYELSLEKQQSGHPAAEMQHIQESVCKDSLSRESKQGIFLTRKKIIRATWVLYHERVRLQAGFYKTFSSDISPWWETPARWRASYLYSLKHLALLLLCRWVLPHACPCQPWYSCNATHTQGHPTQQKEA